MTCHEKLSLIRMTSSTKPKQSLVGIELVRLLAYEGDRIFTTDRARELAPRVGLKDSYFGEALYHLRRNDWIVPLRRGLYALSSTVPGVSDAHEFEVAMALVNPAVISHWSALHYHGLTEQVPREVFILTTTESSVPRIRRTEARIPGGGYPVGDARVSITDVERTLLDGFSMPQYCGDFAEVLHAFEVGMDRLDIERITGYASKLDAATVKRHGDRPRLGTPDSPPKIVGMAFVGLQQVWGVGRGVDRALRGVSERIGNG